MTLPPFDPNAAQHGTGAQQPLTPPAQPATSFSQPGNSYPQAPYSHTQTPNTQYDTSGYGQYGNSDVRATQHVAGWRTVIPMRPLGVADTIDAIIRILKFNPRALIIFPMIVTLITSTISYGLLFLLGETSLLTSAFGAAFSLEENSEAFTIPEGAAALIGLSVFIFLAFTILQTIIIAVAGTRVTVASVRGYKLSLGQTWSLTKPKLGSLAARLIGLSLILIAIVTAAVLVLGILLVALITLFSGGNLSESFDSGAIFLWMPPLLILTYIIGLVFYVRLMLSASALVAEDIGPITAIKRSLHLTKGSVGHLIGLLILSSLLVGALTGVLSFMFTAAPIFLMAGEGMNETMIVILNYITTFMISIIFLPFYTAFTNVVYVNMRFKRENFHQALLHEAASRS
ncbi:MAG: hypothetical protein SPG61_07630 [Arcanobacterium sp.]|nr:hypothetical protein [Arcanobacterium sp.]